MTNLFNTIADYEPNEKAVELVRSTKIALLVGISGAGKDTIKGELLQDAYFRDIISHTTRLPRANNGVMETPDIDYHFVDQQTAEAMIEKHEFIEAKLVHGTIYGTSVEELQKSHDAGKIAITDVDVQGVAEYKDLSQNVVAMFILPPNYSTWRERLAKRYATEADFLAEWDKRRNSAIAELKHALQVPYYHFIINDELTRAVDVVREIAMNTPDIFHSKDDEVRQRARDLLAAIQTSL